jgi:non-specific protein-tyrosine kinase
VIDAAVANPAPIRPRPKVDLAIGGLLGLAVGAGLALVLEALDRTITTADQATAAFGAPSLAALPRDRGLATEPLVALEGANSRSGEGYRSLRTAIRFIDGDRQLRRILISSAGSGEGKTTVAANLAIAFAQSGERVILIDADLRRPRVTELFGVNERPGLTAVILGDVSLEAALQTWRGTLQLLPHGALPPNPSEMLGSESMARVLDEAADRADIVIIDAPPILPVTDATVLAAQVDGVIQVARWGSTAVSDGEATRRTLEAVNAHVVGVALNAVRRGRRSGYYRQYAPAASGRG